MLLRRLSSTCYPLLADYTLRKSLALLPLLLLLLLPLLVVPLLLVEVIAATASASAIASGQSYT